VQGGRCLACAETRFDIKAGCPMAYVCIQPGCEPAPLTHGIFKEVWGQQGLKIVTRSSGCRMGGASHVH
jgi:hypothetical protein